LIKQDEIYNSMIGNSMDKIIMTRRYMAERYMVENSMIEKRYHSRDQGWPAIPTRWFICILLLFLIADLVPQQAMGQSHQPENKKEQSPYVGMQNQAVKALSTSEINALLDGSGTAFGGMAKAAELNGYPGPKHVLELVEEGRMALTDVQLEQIRGLFEEMRSDAVERGERIVDMERRLDALFDEREVTVSLLEELVMEIGVELAHLRTVHLRAHLRMMELLTTEQIETYNVERGYWSRDHDQGSDRGEFDPCERVPDGHDPVMWRMHNGCN